MNLPIKWLFMVDTCKESGFGHFFRSLSIAKKIRQYSQVFFSLTREADLFDYHLDLYKFPNQSHINTQIYTGVFFDGYQFVNWKDEKFKKNNVFTSIIVDSDKQRCDDFDLVISPVTYENQFKHAIVMDEFTTKNDLDRVNNKNTVMINFGSFDSQNMTLKVIKSIECYIVQNDLTLKVITTSSNSNLNEISTYLSKSHLNYKIIVDTFHMSDELASSEIIIGSGGVGLLERMAMRKPSITIVTSSNQYLQSRLAIEMGATLDAGTADNFNGKILCKYLNDLYRSLVLQNQLKENCKRAFDGKGSSRVATMMMQELKEKYAYI